MKPATEGGRTSPGCWRLMSGLVSAKAVEVVSLRMLRMWRYVIVPLEPTNEGKPPPTSSAQPSTSRSSPAKAPSEGLGAGAALEDVGPVRAKLFDQICSCG
mmetsp:Transcript_179/g.482  ORF Transcript_179/g.482 Transcript_179/m.482 type:complete len:101 (-) Transcript_179:1464-1766(-)